MTEYGVVIPMPRCGARLNLGPDNWALRVHAEGHAGKHRSGGIEW